MRFGLLPGSSGNCVKEKTTKGNAEPVLSGLRAEAVGLLHTTRPWLREGLTSLLMIPNAG